MPNNPNREAFEAFYLDGNPACKFTPDAFEKDGDRYTRRPVQEGWICWQAGAQHERDAQPGELCPACASAEFERVSGFGELK